MSLQLNLNDIVEFKSYCGIQPGQLAINTWHYKITSVRGTGTDLATLMGITTLALSAVLKPCMNPVYTYFGMTGQRLVPTTAPYEYDPTTGVGAGTLGAGDIMPFSVAAVISLRTAGIGRANRGRKYISGWGESENAANAVPGAATLTLIAAVLGFALMSQDTGGGNAVVATPGVYHRGAGTLSAYTSGSVRNIWGTQRRRGDFGAKNTLPWLDFA